MLNRDFDPSPSNFDMEGLEDIEIENLDELLDCGDDLMDIEQNAFMGNSR